MDRLLEWRRRCSKIFCWPAREIFPCDWLALATPLPFPLRSVAPTSSHDLDVDPNLLKKRRSFSQSPRIAPKSPSKYPFLGTCAPPPRARFLLPCLSCVQIAILLANLPPHNDRSFAPLQPSPSSRPSQRRVVSTSWRRNGEGGSELSGPSVGTREIQKSTRLWQERRRTCFRELIVVLGSEISTRRGC